jgi:hypothetical protein
VWDPYNEGWEEGFSYLRLFYTREGHCRVNARHHENKFKLGVWVSYQRGIKSKLSQAQIKLLDDLNFNWDPIFEQWERGFYYLEQYRNRKGDCNIVSHHKESGFNLGSWVQTQRKIKRFLSAEQYQRLNAVGFIWEPRNILWESGINYLGKFYAREGHCHVVARWVEDNFNLGQWVGNIRIRRASLIEQKVRILDDMGFVWDPREGQWEMGFNYLRQFQAREGHCKVTQTHIEDGFKLGVWVSSQRQRKDRLTEVQLERLGAIGFIWRVSPRN